MADLIRSTKKKRSSTLTLQGGQKSTKNDSNLQIDFVNQSNSQQNQSTVQLNPSSSPIVDANYKSNLFAQALIINANESFQQELLINVPAKRSQSEKCRQSLATVDSDEYFKEDKELSDGNPKGGLTLQELTEAHLFVKKQNMTIHELPIQEEHPASPRKKNRQNTIKDSVTVTDRELKDPPRDMIFRWDQFLEIFIFHIIYYMFGSILSLLIFRIILRGNKFRLVRNLGFYGVQSIKIWETVTANLFFTMNFLTFFYINNLNRVYLIECVQVLILLLQRAFIVSVKYGFMYPQKFLIYNNRILSKEQLTYEYMLGEWTNEKEKVVDKELNLAMNRLEIEQSSFYLCFIVNPSSEKMEEIKNPVAQSYGEGDLDFTNAAYGPALMKRLILHFNTENSTQFLVVSSVLLSILKEAIFLLAKYLSSDYMPTCASNCFYENFILLATAFSDFYITYTFFLFTAISYRHLRRQIQQFIQEFIIFLFSRILFLMNQLSHLISAKKVEEYEEKKLYPTLNLTSDLSIRSWFHLRNIAMDYGQKFYRRIEYIISFFFIFNFLFMIFIFLISFNIIPNPGKNVKLYFQLQSIYCSLWLFSLVGDIKMGAQVNKHFKIHKMFLMKNLSIIEDICSNYFLYFDQNARCENFMYRELIKYFILTHKDANLNDMSNVVHFIRPILSSLEGGIEQIEFYEKYKPFKITGLPVSNQLLFKLIVFILSLSGAVLASMFLAQ